MMVQAHKAIARSHSLQRAVRNVIENNAALGFPAVRFRQATQEGQHPELLRVCEELILNPSAFAAMERAVQQYPGFLTLEDYAARWGREWGLSALAVEHARASAEAFDRLLGFRRWIAEGEAVDG